jgi:uncharacterized protein YutE (UPF0331/DUF86 family)
MLSYSDSFVWTEKVEKKTADRQSQILFDSPLDVLKMLCDSAIFVKP